METIKLGNQTRHLECTGESIDHATSMLAKLGIDLDPRKALLMRPHDMLVVKVCASGLLVQSMKDKANPRRVGVWLDAELEKFPELEAKTLKEYTRYYTAAGIIEPEGKPGDEDDPPGEATSPDE